MISWREDVKERRTTHYTWHTAHGDHGDGRQPIATDLSDLKKVSRDKDRKNCMHKNIGSWDVKMFRVYTQSPIYLPWNYNKQTNKQKITHHFIFPTKWHVDSSGCLQWDVQHDLDRMETRPPLSDSASKYRKMKIA